jgi:hypothetical protein
VDTIVVYRACSLMASIAPQPSKRFPDGHKVRYRHLDGSAGSLTFPDHANAEKFVKLVDALGVAEAQMTLFVQKTGKTVTIEVNPDQQFIRVAAAA